MENNFHNDRVARDTVETQHVSATKRIRVLDMINTDQCARELLNHRVKQVNDTGRYDNSICCSSGEHVDILRKLGHTVHVVDTPRDLSLLALIGSIWATFRLLRKHKIDIVHTHTSVVGFIGRVAAFLARTPFVVHQIHGFHHHEAMKPIKRWLFVNVEKVLALLCDKLLFQNMADVADCQKRSIAPSRKTVLIGNGVHLNNFRSMRKPQRNPPIILYVTRMEAVKNHPMLFEAAGMLERRAVNFQIQLVGDGELMKRYEGWVFRNKLDRRISFLGYRDDVPELIANSTLCVLVSFKEGLPRGIIETAAAARPMVATDVVGNRDCLINGQTGFLVPLGDADALADKIERLLNDEQLCLRIGREARKYAEENFDERVITKRIIAVYDKAVQNS